MMQTEWRGFLRALAAEIDEELGAVVRDALLRKVGARMARAAPLAPAGSLEVLEMEMNDALAAHGWGSVQLDLQETDRCLLLTHTGLPRASSAGDPPGSWFAAVLEGLYEGWMAQQPGSESSLSARLQPGSAPGTVALRYGRV